MVEKGHAFDFSKINYRIVIEGAEMIPVTRSKIDSKPKTRLIVLQD